MASMLMAGSMEGRKLSEMSSMPVVTCDWVGYFPRRSMRAARMTASWLARYGEPRIRRCLRTSRP